MKKYINKALQDFTINTSCWDTLQNNVTVRLMNKKFLSEYEDIAYMPFLDLAITFVVQEKSDNTILCHSLTNQEIADLGVDIAEVKMVAMQNLKYSRHRRILTLKESTLKNEVMYPLMEVPEGTIIGSGGRSSSSCGVIYDIDKEGYENVLVVSNKNTPFGASYLADFDLLEELYERFGENYYILPMSVHEIMCVKSSYASHQDTKSIQEIEDDFKDMIEALNDSAKSWEDILSYKIYYYYGDDGKKLFCIK